MNAIGRSLAQRLEVRVGVACQHGYPPSRKLARSCLGGVGPELRNQPRLRLCVAGVGARFY